MDARFQYLFICGAKRSGTTILTSLLDGHPSLFVFPREFQVFGKQALGSVSKDDVLPVSSFIPNVQWYFDNFTLRKREGELPFDRQAVLDDLSARGSEEMNRMTFLDLFVERCIVRSGRDPETVEYVVIKTMYNGLDVFDTAVMRHKKIIPHRPSQELFLSYRAKRLKQGYFSYQMLGSFSQHITKMYGQDHIREVSALCGNTFEVALADLKSSPEAVMQRVADWLVIHFEETLTTPTFAGKPFAGHFYDAEKNTGKVVNTVSHHPPMLPVERWAFDYLAQMNTSPSSFVRLCVLSFFSYMLVMVSSAGICLMNIVRTIGQGKRKGLRSIILLPWYVLLMLGSLLLFPFRVWAIGYGNSVRSRWDIFS